MITDEDRAVYRMVLARGWASKDQLDAAGRRLTQAPPDLRLESLLHQAGLIDAQAMAEIHRFKKGGPPAPAAGPTPEASGLNRGGFGSGRQKVQPGDSPSGSKNSRAKPPLLASSSQAQGRPATPAPQAAAAGTASGSVPGGASQARGLSPKDVLIGQTAMRMGLATREGLQKALQGRGPAAGDLDVGQAMVKLGLLDPAAYQHIRSHVDATAFCSDCQNPYPMPGGMAERKGLCPRCAPRDPSPLTQKGPAGPDGDAATIGANAAAQQQLAAHRSGASRNRKPEDAAPAAQKKSGSSLKPGQPFGGFEIVEFVGDGVRSEVYRARSEGREVALKILASGETGATAGEMLRLYELSEVIEAFDQKNILKHHDVGEADGTPYVVMELAKGGSLAQGQRMATMKARPRLALEIAASIARAIDYANEQGVVHGSLKPANILFDAADNPKVSDFISVADAFQAEKSELVYMAPEQIRESKGRDRRLDVYALGAILYEMLTGAAPFEGTTADELARKILAGSPKLPRELDGAIHEEVEAIILKALTRNPNQRYARSSELADDIESHLAGRGLESGAPLPRAAWGGGGKRSPALLYGGIALAVLAAIGIVAAAMVGYRNYAERRSAEAVRTLIAEARELVEEDPDAALGKVEEALTLDADNLEAYLVRAHTAAVRGDVPGALGDIGTVLEKDPSSVEALRLRKTLHEREKKEKATPLLLGDIDALVPLVEETEKYALLLEKARLQESIPAVDEALKTLDEAARLVPKAPEPYLEIARIQLARGKLAPALAAADEAVKRAPGNIRGLALRGEILVEQRENEEALVPLDQVLAKQPDHVASLLARAKAYYRLLRFEESLVEASKVLTFARGDPDALYKAHVLMGFAHIDLSRKHGNDSQAARAELQTSLEHFNGAVAILPKSGRAYLGRAEVQKRLGKPDKALEDAQMAVKLEPGFGQHHAVLGTLLLEQNMPAEALKSLTAALDLDGNDAEALLARGMCYVKLHRYHEAEGDFLAALRARPNFEAAHAYLIDLYSNRSNGPVFEASKALFHAQQLVKLSPRDPRSLYRLHIAFFVSARYEEAEQTLSSAIDLLQQSDPRRPTWARQLGDLRARRER